MDLSHTLTVLFNECVQDIQDGNYVGAWERFQQTVPPLCAKLVEDVQTELDALYAHNPHMYYQLAAIGVIFTLFYITLRFSAKSKQVRLANNQHKETTAQMAENDSTVALEETQQAWAEAEQLAEGQDDVGTEASPSEAVEDQEQVQVEDQETDAEVEEPSAPDMVEAPVEEVEAAQEEVEAAQEEDEAAQEEEETAQNEVETEEVQQEEEHVEEEDQAEEEEHEAQEEHQEEEQVDQVEEQQSEAEEEDKENLVDANVEEKKTYSLRRTRKRNSLYNPQEFITLTTETEATKKDIPNMSPRAAGDKKAANAENVTPRKVAIEESKVPAKAIKMKLDDEEEDNAPPSSPQVRKTAKPKEPSMGTISTPVGRRSTRRRVQPRQFSPSVY